METLHIGFISARLLPRTKSQQPKGKKGKGKKGSYKKKPMLKPMNNGIDAYDIIANYKFPE